MHRLLASLFWLLPGAASAAPLGIFPGTTDLSRARALLGAPIEEKIPAARYHFAAPAGSGFASVELYLGRQTRWVELAEYLYEPAIEASAARAALGQKGADLSYSLADGGSCEVFLARRARLLLGPDGKVRAVSYLSAEAMGLVLAELARWKADRSSPEQALKSLVAALTTGSEAELSAAVGDAMSPEALTELKRRRPSLLLLLDGFSAELPSSKVRAKEVTIKLKQPLYGEAYALFTKKGSEWLLSSLELYEPSPVSPHGALREWMSSFLAKPQSPPKSPAVAPPDFSAMVSAWGEDWGRDILLLQPVGGWLEESKAGAKGELILLGEKGRAVASFVREGRRWRITALEPLEAKP